MIRLYEALIFALTSNVLTFVFDIFSDSCLAFSDSHPFHDLYIPHHPVSLYIIHKP